MGKAYGFFDCKASKGEIEAELPFIRDMTQVPSALEISLTGGIDGLEGDSDLRAVHEKAKSRIVFPDSVGFLDRLKIVEEMRNTDLKYVMAATLPDATNKATADEVSTILNQAYQSPLYQEGEHFRGSIVYQENGKYVFRDKK